MAATLKVTPAQLKSTASEFESEGSQLKTLTGEMMNLITQISGDVWSGDAATAYTGKFKGLQSDMDRMFNMVKEHSQDLTQIANNYEQAENANQDLANSLQQNVIS